MSTLERSRAGTESARRRSSAPYWVAALVAVVGLVGGLALAISSYTSFLGSLATTDRVDLPGMVRVDVDEPAVKVVYLEGLAPGRTDEVSIEVTGPNGVTVATRPYVGEMVFETGELDQARAVATFEARRVGSYELKASGPESAALIVAEGFGRRALPGVLGGLMAAGLSLIAAFVLVVATVVRRNGS